MKKIIFISLFIISSVSCSDELTNSKAEDIISDCLDKNPKIGKELMYVGNKRFYTNKNSDVKRLAFLQKLKKKGYLKIESVSSNKRNNHVTYNISFTDKAKDFVLVSNVKNINSFFGGSAKQRQASVKTFEYEVDEVKEVHEIPSMNTADVTVIYKKTKKTPFYELESDKSEFKTSKVIFRKTTDNGWKYCE
jgi:hypothetical protein